MEMVQIPLHRTDACDADPHADPHDDVADDLEALQHRVAVLWTVEPRGRTATRGRLHDELHRLEAALDRLSLLAAAGEYVPQGATSACASRYHALRRRWSGDDLAA